MVKQYQVGAIWDHFIHDLLAMALPPIYTYIITYYDCKTFPLVKQKYTLDILSSLVHLEEQSRSCQSQFTKANQHALQSNYIITVWLSLGRMSTTGIDLPSTRGNIVIVSIQENIKLIFGPNPILSPSLEH